MIRLEIIVFLLMSCSQILTEHRDYYGSYNQYGHQRYHNQGWDDDRMVKEVRVEQGRLKGLVVQPKTNPRLQLVDVFLGVPYAEPPVGPFRFSPPRSPQPWRDIRFAQEFAPVCPQVLPNLRDEVKPGRHEYLERLLPYLKNQSEDCLYLNIYAPHQPEGQTNLRRYPVMVFIHGESFDWNSGNPYDGTVIAAYGNVVFVTINFRLGILGFLRPGTSDDVASNFGLLDQTAALLWLKENIAKFGGDPDTVTIVGHGTGAIFTNLLLISPVANNKGLFKRAILMSGSALSYDAIGKAPLQITKQVAYALNCPTTDDNELAVCLRNRDVDSLLNVKIDKPRFVPAFAPLIDRAVIPKKPLRLMENAQVFGSFDLMYGITESEKFHVLPPVAVLHGMLDGQRDEVLHEHAKATHELEPELILSKVLEHYGGESLDGFSNDYPTKNRDIVLDAFSDSAVVAPLVLMGRIHAKANPKNYMYVFSHPRAMHDYSGQHRQHTVHGEEIPYMLGVPLDGGKYHLRGRYNIGETLFSEAMMTWWCNFAYTGNPNAPKRLTYLTDGPKEWRQYQLDWPEFNFIDETYFNLTIPPKVGRHYRSAEMQFWNEDIPNLIRHRPRGPRPEFLDRADGIGKYRNMNSSKPVNGFGMKYTTAIPSSLGSGYGLTNEQESPSNRFPFSQLNGDSKQDDSKPVIEEGMFKGSSAITMIIGFGIVFLLINLSAFFYLYHRRQSLKNKEQSAAKKLNRRFSNKSGHNGAGSRKSKANKQVENPIELSRKCDSKPDIHEVVKSDKAYDNSSNFGRQSKLSRQNSNSTIDTHIKVKEWIQQEIVHRCSPRFLRKTRETLQKEHEEKLTKQHQKGDDERKKNEEEQLKTTKLEPIYDQNPALIVRPGGKKPKVPKVSVAVDATPATRTESILNQIPIELVKDLNSLEGTSPYDQVEFIDVRATPQVVVIEHHHSRSDPLPMETVFKTIRPNFPTNRVCESDSGSASSLYAKINPKVKTKLPSFDQSDTLEEDVSNDTCDGSEISKITEGNIYGRIPQMTTFAVDQPKDINVTCREPITERENVSPEEALKTIKRRNYPKVLPDIEKRRSLPATSSFCPPRQFGNALMDHRKGSHPPCVGGCPPQPPPRMFGTSKSLDLPEEDEREPITTNLHVGPLLKRQDSTGKNRSDSSIIDSIERIAIDAQEVLFNHRNESAGLNTTTSITANPKCPVHGTSFGLLDENLESASSRSVDGLDRNLSKSSNRDCNYSSSSTKTSTNTSLPNVSTKNPNWYLSMRKRNNENQFTDGKDFTSSIENTPIPPKINQDIPEGMKIVITPKVPNIPSTQDLITPQLLNHEQKNAFAPTEKVSVIDMELLKQNDGSIIRQGAVESSAPVINSSTLDRKNPKVIIAPTGTLEQPKIIIKPTSNLGRSRERNIPKVSAIPSPETPNLQSTEKVNKGMTDTIDKKSEKPQLKEKPKLTRVPSITRRQPGEPSSPIYSEKVEIVQRIHVGLNNPVSSDGKSNIPTLKTELMRTDSFTSSSDSSFNTNTIKRKPMEKN
ncbi:uncharacterized protein [Chelonus insularis]|uniref:uncharacterized protein n=1 Tax=Chelonus insularis TaxID=460826 RepID=UPI0015892FC8|nr:uncharacterized protein LOC118071932 [Chelonus insularis]